MCISNSTTGTVSQESPILGPHNGGRQSKYTPEEISVLVELATIPPRVLGFPFGVS